MARERQVPTTHKDCAGENLRVKADAAGKVKCPVCGKAVPGLVVNGVATLPWHLDERPRRKAP